MYVSSDTPERALPWITRAVEIRDPGVTYMGAVPFPPVIKDSPEIAALTEAVGIPNQDIGSGSRPGA